MAVCLHRTLQKILSSDLAFFPQQKFLSGTIFVEYDVN